MELLPGSETFSGKICASLEVTVLQEMTVMRPCSGMRCEKQRTTCQIPCWTLAKEDGLEDMREAEAGMPVFLSWLIVSR